VVLDRDVPPTIKGNIRRSVTTFLDDHRLDPEDLAFTLLHPGGRKLVDHIETELALSPDMTALSRSVLRDHGNMSSATIFYVIERFLREFASSYATGEKGLIAAMGPGFSIEQLLTEWDAG
jgi:alkylresorcinol/alkylpyrone synthase